MSMTITARMPPLFSTTPVSTSLPDVVVLMGGCPLTQVAVRHFMSSCHDMTVLSIPDPTAFLALPVQVRQRVTHLFFHPDGLEQGSLLGLCSLSAIRVRCGWRQRVNILVMSGLPVPQAFALSSADRVVSDTVSPGTLMMVIALWLRGWRDRALYTLATPLSAVEIDVLQGLLLGHSPQAVAKHRDRTTKTISAQKRSALGKLGAKRMADLLRIQRGGS
ncbi:hypothetical protein [Serratia fonticola]|uniref:helix-turn-helix transcriptional regulator n=1 Tax=Serratia fonticola TaxID=47917 RepID=UPI00301DA2DD